MLIFAARGIQYGAPLTLQLFYPRSGVLGFAGVGQPSPAHQPARPTP